MYGESGQVRHVEGDVEELIMLGAVLLLDRLRSTTSDPDGWIVRRDLLRRARALLADHANASR